MNKTLLAALAFTTLTLMAVGASAQDNQRQNTRPSGSAPEVTHNFVDGSSVSGNHRSPNGIPVWTLRGRRGQTLVRTRTHFFPQLRHSVENL